MLKKAKILFLIVGIITGIIGVYLFVLMDFTIIETATGTTDGLGFTLVNGLEAEGFSRFIYNISSFIPLLGDTTHATTFWYIVVRAVDFVLLIVSFGFILYGVMGPENEMEMDAMVYGVDEGELE